MFSILAGESGLQVRPLILSDHRIVDGNCHYLNQETSSSTALNQGVKLGKTSGYPPPTVPALRAQRNGPHGAFPSSAGH